MVSTAVELNCSSVRLLPLMISVYINLTVDLIMGKQSIFSVEHGNVICVSSINLSK